MTLARKTGLNAISPKRLEQFGGRMPFNSLEKPGGVRPVWTPKRSEDTGPDEATVKLVLKRDEWRCACCGDPLYGDRGSEWCVAHRVLRAHGVNNQPSNLYASCMACERLTHAHPERSRDAGRMLKSTEDPLVEQMEHAVHGTVLLDNDGRFAVIQAVVVEETDEHPF